jgi:hypothetical protein
MRRLAVLAFLLFPAWAPAEDWKPLEFLIGQWSGAGSGAPGASAGAFSFQPDLQGEVLIRKSFAEYPAAAGKPASRHDDLLIVFREGAERRLRAIYFDSEGHIIRYLVEAGQNRVVFTSEGGRAEARYRMTYRAAGPDQLGFQFEVAAPGKDLAPYIEAVLQRASASAR